MKRKLARKLSISDEHGSLGVVIVLFQMVADHKTRYDRNMMKFKFAVKDLDRALFSLDKVNADFFNNQMILNTMVGTLVKYDQSGKIEPYLADQWSESSDQKSWSFHIRPNLKTQDDREISPSLIVNTLTTNLKEYSKNGSVLVFDHLIGWQEFVNGSKLEGLSAEGEYVKFNFTDDPGGLLEFLRMAYFGLWLEKDGQIISTAAYQLEQFDPHRISLRKRKDWFTVTEESSENIEFSFEKINENEFDQKTNSTITRFPFFIDRHESSNGFWILSPPNTLEAITLSPVRDGYFKNKQNRQVFLNRARSWISKHKQGSHLFYQSAKPDNLIENDFFKYTQTSNNNEVITIAIRMTNFSHDRLSSLKELYNFSLEGSGLSYEIIPLETKDANWIKRNDLNKEYDSRVGFVDIDGYPDFAVLKMMLCSKMGINFPDPSGSICSLVNEGITSGTPMNQNFINRFNQALYDDAAVIPINHHSDKWFVTNDIDPKTLPPITIYPQFELIRYRQK